MTHTIGKIELGTVHMNALEPEIKADDDLTIAYMVGYVKGKDFAKREAVQRLAKYFCNQDERDTDETCLNLARHILGVR